MNLPLRTSLCALVCVLSLALAPPARADVGRDEASAAAQRVAGGRVLAVDRAEVDRRPVWRVKIINARGEVHIVIVDAATGRVVG